LYKSVDWQKMTEISGNNNQDGKLLRVVDVHKYFGKVKALIGVDFAVGENEVVGLIGDNGAGKSTLVKIIFGVFKPTKGKIFYKGNEISWSSPKEAMESGIESIQQDQSLVEEMALYRNFFLGREITNRLGLLDIKKMEGEALKELRNLGLDLRSADVAVNQLSGGQRQGLAISRALYFDSDLVIFDEPTNNLSVAETKKVYQMIDGLKTKGVSAIVISHAMGSVYPVSDRIVLLRRGEKAGEFRRDETSVEECERLLMHGKE